MMMMTIIDDYHDNSDHDDNYRNDATSESSEIIVRTQDLINFRQ